MSQGHDHREFQLTFEGLLAVRLMEFDYQGMHYSYHGAKLKDAVRRLLAEPPEKATAAELFIRYAASRTGADITADPEEKSIPTAESKEE